MNTSPSNLTIPKTLALTADTQSDVESIHPTLLSNDLLGYVSWLKLRVDLLAKTGLRCNESKETILTKISDLFSREISHLEKVLKQTTESGQLEMDFDGQWD